MNFNFGDKVIVGKKLKGIITKTRDILPLDTSVVCIELTDGDHIYLIVQNFQIELLNYK